MSLRRHLHFGETKSFSNLYGEVLRNTDKHGRHAYAGYNPELGLPPTEEQIILLNEYQVTLPILTFTGTEKLHGENMAVCYTNGELWVQGRNHIRTILGDQNGMAAFVSKTESSWIHIITALVNLHTLNLQTHTLVIDCEWAGENIQKGNAACSGTPKGAYIFKYARVVDNSDDSFRLVSTMSLQDKLVSIYNMTTFRNYTIVLDFNNPDQCVTKLEELVATVEAASPIATYHNKPDNVGEGVYLYCLSHGDHPTYRLKAKGLLHGGKPKTPQTQDPLSSEEMIKLDLIASQITPEWRLNQAISETNATEVKHIGEVIRWVLNDVVKEEIHTISAANVEFDKLKKYVTNIVKTYYLDSIKQY